MLTIDVSAWVTHHICFDCCQDFQIALSVVDVNQIVYEWCSIRTFFLVCVGQEANVCLVIFEQTFFYQNSSEQNYTKK